MVLVYGLKIQGILLEVGDQHHVFNSKEFQGNGQVEATNKTILNKLKKSLKQAKRKWAKVLLEVL